MYLKAYRRFNKVINIAQNEIEEEPYDDIKRATIRTSGFYFKGLKGDLLMFFVANGNPMIKFKEITHNILEKDIKFSCERITEKEWVFKCTSPKNSFQFHYCPYVYDPYDDDDESDVNFGLWIISLLQESDKLERVIKTNKS